MNDLEQRIAELTARIQSAEKFREHIERLVPHLDQLNDQQSRQDLAVMAITGLIASFNEFRAEVKSDLAAIAADVRSKGPASPAQNMPVFIPSHNENPTLRKS